MDHSKEFIAIVDQSKSRVSEVTVEDLVKKRNNHERFHLIDVREDDEWRAGHAAGAEHIGKGVIERDIVTKVPNKDEPLVLYCGGGFRSILAADAIQKMGYRNVLSLAGGWKAWCAKNLATEK